MPLIASLVDYQVEFLLNVSPKKIKMTDQSNWAGAAWPGGPNSAAIFRLTGPDGTVFYENAGWGTDSFAAPDMVPYPLSAPGYDITFEYSLPLDSTSAVLLGDYIIEAKYKDAAGDPVSQSKTFNFCHASPTADLQPTTNCFQSKITAVDATDYSSPAGTYTLTLSRVHKLYYPPALDRDPEETTGNEIVVSPIYSKTWTEAIATTATYTFANGIVIVDLIEASTEFKVECDINLCDVYCGVASLNNRYKEYVAVGNAKRAAEVKGQLDRVTQLMVLFRQAQECNQGDAANDLLAEMYVVGDFLPGCGCESDEPVQIIALDGGGGSGGIDDVTGDGSTVTVTSPSSSTRQVALSSTYKNKIDNLDLVQFATDTSSIVAFAESSVGYVRTVKINVTIPALGADAVATANIQNLAVSTAKLADDSVTAAKIATGAVGTPEIADGAVTTAKYAAGSINTAAIADAAVTTAKIADANVTTAKLADNAVTTAKILDSNVTTAKIADGNVTTTKIADNAITTAKILDDNVTAAKILDGAVTQTKIAAGAVANTQLAANAVTTSKVQDGAITTVKIADANITTAKILDQNVTTAKIADGNVTVIKMESALLYRDVYFILSFEANEVGTWTIPVSYNGLITSATATVIKTLGAVDNGTINVTGIAPFVPIPLFTILASSVVGTTATVAATGNIVAGGTLSFTTAKTTAGGRVLLHLKIQQTP